MKKQLLLVGMAMFAVLFVSSCQKSETYSCDPELNKWATKNYDILQSFDRPDFIKLDATYQMAAYGTFKPIQKQLIWIDKITETILLGWSDIEVAHLEKALTAISNNLNWFIYPSPTEDEMDLFFYSWIEYAKDSLLWDYETIEYIIADPNSILKLEDGTVDFIDQQYFQDRYGHKEITSQILKTRTENGPVDPNDKCLCNTENQFGCGNSKLLECRLYNCWPTGGCGPIFGKECNGKCFRTDL